jgi:cytochrome c oxidase subunit II
LLGRRWPASETGKEEDATFRRTPRRAHLVVFASCLLCLLAAGCSSKSPSVVAPSGPKAGFVANAWWVLTGVAAFVCIVVIALAVGALVFRRRAKKVDTEGGQRPVVVFGLVSPAVVFAATFALSLTGIAVNAQPPSPDRVTVRVIGHQWWWGVKYPKAGVTTANEIHVPTGEPVRLDLVTDDVIHSFWVPQITPKMDLIPNRPNTTWFSVDKSGVYRGQCAEYCGLQHAHMAFEVIAQPRAQFEKWLRGQQRPAPAPATAEEQHGMSVFETGTCATCHTIRGTTADGHVGPDLTHVGSRRRLAAGTIPNNVGHMAGWIANSQDIKPGNLMPPQPLSPDDLRAVVTYLQSLE